MNSRFCVNGRMLELVQLEVLQRRPIIKRISHAALSALKHPHFAVILFEVQHEAILTHQREVRKADRSIQSMAIPVSIGDPLNKVYHSKNHHISNTIIPREIDQPKTSGCNTTMRG